MEHALRVHEFNLRGVARIVVTELNRQMEDATFPLSVIWAKYYGLPFMQYVLVNVKVDIYNWVRLGVVSAYLEQPILGHSNTVSIP